MWMLYVTTPLAATHAIVLKDIEEMDLIVNVSLKQIVMHFSKIVSRLRHGQTNLQIGRQMNRLTTNRFTTNRLTDR